MLLFAPSGNTFIHALSTQNIQRFKSLSQTCNSARTVIVLVTQVNEDKISVHRLCECSVSSVRLYVTEPLLANHFKATMYIIFSQKYRRKTDS
jgi:hypothetical protein